MKKQEYNYPGYCPNCKTELKYKQILMMNIFFPITCEKCKTKIMPVKKIYSLASVFSICFVYIIMFFYGMPIVKFMDNIILKLVIFIIEFTLLGLITLYFLKNTVPLKIKNE
ncbi:MAG: hypothetical protein PF487_13260 [Bacteroidales bacterium]|jgi:hypothetical protein|nr:hypothetical protein [Bacteroidales bacterium]